MEAGYATILTRPVTGPSAWKGPDMAASAAWIHRLTPGALAEIDAAVQAVVRSGLPLYSVGRDDFPLPGLACELAAIAEELEHGRGFVQIKGLPVERYALDEARIAYWGIGAHLGRAVSQNARGELLCDVRDYGAEMGAAGVRGYQTRSASPFHCDECDIVGLLCWRPARSGGASALVSSMALYNEMLRRHPWFLGLLYAPFPHDWRGEQAPGRPPVYRWPVFEYFDQRLACRYSRRTIESAYRAMGGEPSPVERECFDLMDALIAELQLEIDFEPGDMQFLNNYVVLHARTAFTDHPEPERRRHLLRLWLNAGDGRALSPEVTAERDVRSGVAVTAA